MEKKNVVNIGTQKIEAQKWLKTHPDFMEAMDSAAYEVENGLWGPEEKFDDRTVQQMLDTEGFDVDFSAKILLKEWRETNIRN